MEWSLGSGVSYLSTEETSGRKIRGLCAISQGQCFSYRTFFSGVRWPGLGCLQSYGFLAGRARSIVDCACRASRQSLSNRDVLTRIGWPTLAWRPRRRRYKLFLFWQLTKGQGPPPLAVPACVSTRASQTLRKRTIEMPLCRLELRRRSFLPSCITLWNSLPLSITSCSSSSSFLSSLDSQFKPDMYCFGL